MKKVLFLAAGFGLLFFFTAGVMAEETPAGPWQGDVELGYLMSTGNTEASSLNARLGIAYDVTEWRYSLDYESVYSREKVAGMTARRFLVSGRTKYRMAPDNSIYGLALYENDRFSAYDCQVTVSAGYNRRIIFTDTVEWSAEAGPGYRYSNYRDNRTSSKDEAIVHLGTDFIYRFTETASFEETLTADIGEDNTRIRSISSLRVMLSDRLSLRVSCTLRHVTEVPEPLKKTDTETFVSLAYGF